MAKVGQFLVAIDKEPPKGAPFHAALQAASSAGLSEQGTDHRGAKASSK